METNGNNIDRPVDIKELFFRIIYSWRKIILLSLVLAVILGGYKFYSETRNLNGLSQEDNYQTAMKAYRLNKAVLESEINHLLQSIEEQKEYNENSVLMQINPLDKQVASINYYVATGYKIMPEVTYQNVDITNMIIGSYNIIVSKGEMYQYIMDNLSFDIEPRYLKEIITATADFNTHMISIDIVHNERKQCEEIYRLVMDYFNQAKNDITEKIGEHTISIIDDSIQSVVDLSLDEYQKNNYLLISDYETKLQEKQAEMSALIVPVKSTNSVTVVINNSIKYGIFGFVIGMMLSAFLLLSINLLSDRLTGTKELRDRFNIRILGEIKKKRKKKFFGFIDLWLEKMEGKVSSNMAEVEEIKRVCANIKAVLHMEKYGNSKVMLTGTANINKIIGICDKLNKEMTESHVQIISGANICYTASTIESIQDCGSVVIVEEINNSTYTEITKQIININDLNKKIIGAVLI
jgi:capsular polysaccharide biosynthesis protein